MKPAFKNSLKDFRFTRKQKSIARTILISLATCLILIGSVFAIVWHYRGRVFTYLTTYSDQSHVESAVASANQAVVAITISKLEPNYTTTYLNIDPFNGTDPFSGVFGGTDPFNNLQVPTQVPSGGSSVQEIGAGSGFLISSDGMIVTNKHVVSDAKATYTVYLSNGKKYDAKVLARDAVLDVAIVKIDATGLPYLPLGDSKSLKLGQSVIAIGNALGQFQNTISLGIVSGLSRSIVAGDEGSDASESLNHVIQTDAAINPGNSGGPLLDLSGRVVGIDTAIVEGSENIGFALPIDTLKTVITSVENTGKIVRPYLGIRYVEIDDQLQSDKKLAVDYGDLVEKGDAKGDDAVIKGSPADKAGIVDGDIILDADGVQLTSDQDLSEIVRSHGVGDTITLTVLKKDGTHSDVLIKLEAAPEEKN